MGGEGACITSRMSFGGWLYPEGPSIGVADAAVKFNKDACDCAARGRDTAQARSAPIKRQFKTFRTCITYLRFDSPAAVARDALTDHSGQILLGGNWQVNGKRWN